MRRIALGIEYNGHDFYGWQFQPHLPTIQGYLQTALSRIADEPVHVHCAGRTDAGVHAIGQIVHFDTNAIRDLHAWIFGVNTHLPPTIAVQFAIEVNEHFHARFSALSRSYRYVILNQSIRSALLAARVTEYRMPLNEKHMHEAAQYLLGEHDFSSFRASECDSKTPMRNVRSISVTRQEDFVILEIEANAFLHHMVRNIAGTLMRIGAGLLEVSSIQSILSAKDRKAAFETAAPHGLYLARVSYPPEYQLPERQNPLLFL